MGLASGCFSSRFLAPFGRGNKLLHHQLILKPLRVLSQTNPLFSCTCSFARQDRPLVGFVLGKKDEDRNKSESRREERREEVPQALGHGGMRWNEME